MCICECRCVEIRVWDPQEVRSSCEVTEVGARSRTPILWMHSKCS